MNNAIKHLVGILKKYNRKRNYKLKKIKNIIRSFACDSWFKSKTKIPRPNEIKKVVFLSFKHGIGDAIVMTGAIKTLSEHGILVSVISEKRTSFIFESNKYVYKTHSICDFDNSIMEDVSSEKYDILLDVNDINANSPQRLKIIKNARAKHVVGFNQKHLRTYDTSICYTEKKAHISDRYTAVLKKIGFDAPLFKYSVDIPEDDSIETNKFLKKLDFHKLIVVNPFATEKSRNLGDEQLNDIIRYLGGLKDVVTIIIGHQNIISKIPLIENVIALPFTSFFCAAQALKRSDLVISPDTSIVHLSNAFDKKLISLYNNKTGPEGECINSVWGPNYKNAVQILSPTNQVADIPSRTIINLISKMLYSL